MVLNPGKEKQDCCWVCGERATHKHRITGELTCDDHSFDIDAVPIGAGKQHA